ncbi:NAD(P)-dependent malic enzyme [Micrococcoides hystricis]|uniref:NADP-dependent malic enzyme n=1 Tax=Micrococcoides hystricis TaxID=1572761 RepID=A0ABV6PAH0_9MICC
MTSQPTTETNDAENRAAQTITDDEVFNAHLGGKLSVEATLPLNSKRDLSIAYTPGVAKVSQAIADDPAKVTTHTWAGRMVAVVSDGTSVLGLGNIGAAASLPVMEGKSALFKNFAGLDSIPLVLDTTDVDEIIETLIRLRPSFGAVNLEDISAPRCFELERRLVEELDCPVMHDDQHGTAVVVLAAVHSGIKLTGKKLSDMKAVIVGAGAAGIAVTELLQVAGIGDVIIVDSKGTVHRDRDDLNAIKAEYAARTNKNNIFGNLGDALAGADLIVGVSTGQWSEEDLAKMNDDAMIFALSNPTPEVHPDIAKQYAAVVATGRSDFPNQINNVLAFPGIFRGALDSGAQKITTEMKLAAAQALSDLVGDDLAPDYIVPSPLDERVAPAVAKAVAAVADQ